MRNSHFAIAALLSALLILWGCESSKTTEKDGLTTEIDSITIVMDSLITDETKNEIQVDETAVDSVSAIQEMGEKIEVPGSYDFNGDGQLELCYLVEPIMYAEEGKFNECEGDCHCLIEFSDGSIPPIEVEYCIGGMPDILGDLDGNGTIEIGIWPIWWTSCWHAYHVFTLVDGEWTHFVEPFSVHCDLIEEVDASEPLIKPVEGSKDSFMIRYSDFDIDVEEVIQTKTKIVTKLI